jgi:hypothetical protein
MPTFGCHLLNRFAHGLRHAVKRDDDLRAGIYGLVRLPDHINVVWVEPAACPANIDNRDTGIKPVVEPNTPVLYSVTCFAAVHESGYVRQVIALTEENAREQAKTASLQRSPLTESNMGTT